MGSRLMANDEDSARVPPAPAEGPAAPGAPGAPAGATDRMDPLALTVAQAARLLSAAGGIAVTEEAIRGHIEAGAPTTADGRINLVNYAAWLNKDMP